MSLDVDSPAKDKPPRLRSSFPGFQTAGVDTLTSRFLMKILVSIM